MSMLKLQPLLTESRITWKMFEKGLNMTGTTMLPSSEDDEESQFQNMDEAKSAFENMKTEFDSLPDPIPVYRLLAVNSEDEIDLEMPGRHWTYVKDVLDALVKNNTIVIHGKSKLFLLSGLIKKSDVDWQATVSLYAEYTMQQEYSGDAEYEISISRDDRIKNLTCVPYSITRSVIKETLSVQQKGMEERALQVARKLNIPVTADKKLILYHGTPYFKKIRESGILKRGTYFGSDEKIAQDYADSRKVGAVLKVAVPAWALFDTILPDGHRAYFSLNEEVPLEEIK